MCRDQKSPEWDHEAAMAASSRGAIGGPQEACGAHNSKVETQRGRLRIYLCGVRYPVMAQRSVGVIVVLSRWRPGWCGTLVQSQCLVLSVHTQLHAWKHVQVLICKN